MLVYSPSITNRLRYILDFTGRLLVGEPISITDDKAFFLTADKIKINYSTDSFEGSDLNILPHSLLFEQGIREQQVDVFDFNGVKAFFKTGGDWPFDLFAASFYLLSRYEEHLPYKKDEYGRYAHINSLAYREKFLDQPLINEWIESFKRFLGDRYPSTQFYKPVFSFLPTYDIDEAYSFKFKQWWRSRGGAIKDLLKGNREKHSLRKKVLEGKAVDPFDSYAWMDKLHDKYVLHPHYFFLVAEKTAKYDRNILPTEPALKELISRHAAKYSLGVHPSWQSYGKLEIIKSEIAYLENTSGQKIISSRQHFIRFELPQTYRMLMDAGILKDFSMGYGSINGFRASVANSFYWYDLEKEEQTNLLVYPFCYMDANSFFEQRLSPEAALQEMKDYYKKVREVGGMMITIWHNTFLGTDPLFSGWREVYKEFLEELNGG